MNAKDREREMTTQQHQIQYICRIRFARKGSLSYIGHLDLMRTFERAIRRTELPLLHTQGYNPRPILVFALPLGVGISTESDYVDIAFSVPVPPEQVIREMNRFLPPDLWTVDGVVVPEGTGSVMAAVTSASYRFEAPKILPYVRRALEADSLLVTKISKGETREVDIRPLILMDLTADDAKGEDVVCLLFRAGSRENLRPDLFLSALTRHFAYDEDAAANCRVTRTGLFTGVFPNYTDLKEI